MSLVTRAGTPIPNTGAPSFNSGPRTFDGELKSTQPIPKAQSDHPDLKTALTRTDDFAEEIMSSTSHQVWGQVARHLRKKFLEAVQVAIAEEEAGLNRLRDTEAELL